MDDRQKSWHERESPGNR